MQRTYTKPADSKECRPKTAGEVIIENLKKDGDVIGIEVDGEKWSVEKLCRHEECQYCESAPCTSLSNSRMSMLTMASVSLWCISKAMNVRWLL